MTTAQGLQRLQEHIIRNIKKRNKLNLNVNIAIMPIETIFTVLIQ